MKGSRSMTIDENHLRTIEKFNLLADLLDSNGIVDENVLNKLQLNARSLLDNTNGNPELLNLCKDVIFHNNMKAFALHQLILLYIDWQKEQLENLKGEIETEAEA
jgi:hypothetical protein